MSSKKSTLFDELDIIDIDSIEFGDPELWLIDDDESKAYPPLAQKVTNYFERTLPMFEGMSLIMDTSQPQLYDSGIFNQPSTAAASCATSCHNQTTTSDNHNSHTSNGNGNGNGCCPNESSNVTSSTTCETFQSFDEPNEHISLIAQMNKMKIDETIVPVTLPNLDVVNDDATVWCANYPTIIRSSKNFGNNSETTSENEYVSASSSINEDDFPCDLAARNNLNMPASTPIHRIPKLSRTHAIMESQDEEEFVDYFYSIAKENDQTLSNAATFIVPKVPENSTKKEVLKVENGQAAVLPPQPMRSTGEPNALKSKEIEFVSRIPKRSQIPKLRTTRR